MEQEGGRVSDSSPQPHSAYLKPRAGFCGLAAKPIRTSNGGKEKTVRCGLESEIKLVRIVLTPTHHRSVQPLGKPGRRSQSAYLLSHLYFNASLTASFTFKHLILTPPRCLSLRAPLVSSVPTGMSDGI